MAKQAIRPLDNKTNVIELVDLVKQFGEKTVLKDLNLAINKGEFVTLLGASGSGKTTALRLIGGFEWPTRGEIKINGIDVKDLPAYKRPTNTIFQDYALFPHLTVEGNIKYGLGLVRVPKSRVDLLLAAEIKKIKRKSEADKNKLSTEFELLALESSKIQKKLEKTIAKLRIKHTKLGSKLLKSISLTKFAVTKNDGLITDLEAATKKTTDASLKSKHAISIQQLRTSSDNIWSKSAFLDKKLKLSIQELEKQIAFYENALKVQTTTFKTKSEKVKEKLVREFAKIDDKLLDNINKAQPRFELQRQKVEKELADVKNVLAKNQVTWQKFAEAKKKELNNEMSKKSKILEKDPTNIRAQKWLDKSDFTYSYWDSYVMQKTEAYENKHTNRKLSRAEIEAKVADVIKMVRLEGNAKKSIDQLSGGMKQRVALARAIVTEPKILLLDEPLSALDLKVRQAMQRELKAIQRKLGITFVFVTHDQEEAMTMSDRIAVMRDGRIEQYDSPKRIYEFPTNSWVAGFIGESNLFRAKVIKQNVVSILGKEVPGDTYEFTVGKTVDFMIRPEDIEISSDQSKGFFTGEISSAVYQGAYWEYNIKNKIIKTKFIVRTTKSYQLGQEVGLYWESTDAHTMECDKYAKN